MLLLLPAVAAGGGGGVCAGADPLQPWHHPAGSDMDQILHPPEKKKEDKVKEAEVKEDKVKEDEGKEDKEQWVVGDQFHMRFPLGRPVSH